ncbi:MAG: hypothetical protein O3B01_22780 [Planctomycetota bacterium]|nr:hypothetical protein [Planctomycetota bacterium]MDA1141397.1 hypothetical protein [Planctomycetota bacterium]
MSFLIRQRKLPHWDVPGASYFVTACLAGSIPASGMLNLKKYRERLAGQKSPDDLTEDDWLDRIHKLVFARLDQFLDNEPAARHLRDPRLADQVRRSLYHFAGERYDLIAFVVMESHYHWLFRPKASYEMELVARQDDRSARESIMHSIASYTANQCNKLLGRTGQFWEDESYDHCPRDGAEAMRILDYIENNPVVAGLVPRPEDWPFSSAVDRKKLGLKPGAPLVMP